MFLLQSVMFFSLEEQVLRFLTFLLKKVRQKATSHVVEGLGLPSFIILLF